MTGRRSQSAEGLQGGVPLQPLLGRPGAGEPGGRPHEHHRQAGPGHRHPDPLAGGSAAAEETKVNRLSKRQSEICNLFSDLESLWNMEISKGFIDTYVCTRGN